MFNLVNLLCFWSPLCLINAASSALSPQSAYLSLLHTTPQGLIVSAQGHINAWTLMSRNGTPNPIGMWLPPPGLVRTQYNFLNPKSLLNKIFLHQGSEKNDRSFTSEFSLASSTKRRFLFCPKSHPPWETWVMFDWAFSCTEEISTPWLTDDFLLMRRLPALNAATRSSLSDVHDKLLPCRCPLRVWSIFFPLHLCSPRL